MGVPSTETGCVIVYTEAGGAGSIDTKSGHLLGWTEDPYNWAAFSSDRVPTNPGYGEFIDRTTVRISEFDNDVGIQSLGDIMIPDLDRIYMEFKVEAVGSNPAFDPQDVSVGYFTHNRWTDYFATTGEVDWVKMPDPFYYDGYPTNPSSADGVGYVGCAFVEPESETKVEWGGASDSASAAFNTITPAWGDIIMIAVNRTDIGSNSGGVFIGINGVWVGNFGNPDFEDVGHSQVQLNQIHWLDGNPYMPRYIGAFVNADVTREDPALQVDVTVYGSNSAPFNYPIPTGFNGT